MKKLLGMVALSALTTSLFGQGLVQFNNGQATGPVMQWTSTSDPTPIAIPKTAAGVVNGRIEVLAFYNSTTASLTPMFSSVAGLGVSANYTTLAGFLAANSGWATYGTVAITSLQNGVFNDAVQTVGAGTPGAPVSYAILGWTGAFATYDDAVAGGAFLGISSVFTTPSGNPTTTPPGSAISISGTFTGLTLAPQVPEPTSFALAGLGLAALLVFRRRS